METKSELSRYLENISLLILGGLFLAFPLVFTNQTTDAFVLPKQLLLGTAVLLLVVIVVAKMVSEGRLVFRRTPYDLPVILLLLFTLLSSVFSVNRFDSLIAFVPFLFAIVAYFLIVNLVKTKQALIFLLSAGLVGVGISVALGVLSYLKVYPLPLTFTHAQTFSTLGALLDQAIYLLILLPAAAYFAFPITKVKNAKEVTTTMVSSSILLLILAVGLSVTIYQLIVLQQPLILPFETGFQTAFAAISQDSPRTLLGFLFGSGFGTYFIDFTKFKQAAFNLNPTLWSFTFFRSSSFVLELLATTGVLGLFAFIYLILKIIRSKQGGRNPIFVSLILGILLSFLLPFSFTIYALLILLLGLFAVASGFGNPDSIFDLEFHFVALRKGLIAIEGGQQKTFTRFLPITFSAILLLIAGLIGFFSVKYALSDFTFQKSLVASSQNNGALVYSLQSQSINTFPYRDGFYRVFSQTNLALANALIAAQPKGSSPSAQTQQTIQQLIQQSVSSARQAADISPQNTIDWQNLSSIYRSLIGAAQGSENFALVTTQQAAQLDPNNPQEYLNLGGIYYQLGQWDNAQRQFQIAVNLKPDFANAYYNLGHALENKGDLQNALAQYQVVKSLVTNDKNSLKAISAEIDALQKKIGYAEQNKKNQAQQANPAVQNQPPLGINAPSAQLPPSAPAVSVPPPPNASNSAK